MLISDQRSCLTFLIFFPQGTTLFSLFLSFWFGAPDLEQICNISSSKLFESISSALLSPIAHILVTTTTTGGSVLLFHADVLFSIQNAKCLHILAHFDYFRANSRTFWCTFTGLNNAVVYHN